MADTSVWSDPGVTPLLSSAPERTSQKTLCLHVLAQPWFRQDSKAWLSGPAETKLC